MGFYKSASVVLTIFVSNLSGLLFSDSVPRRAGRDVANDSCNPGILMRRDYSDVCITTIPLLMPFMCPYRKHRHPRIKYSNASQKRTFRQKFDNTDKSHSELLFFAYEKSELLKKDNFLSLYLINCTEMPI